MTMKREGRAQWRGDLKSGKGTVSTGSGALDGNPYGFNTRFENEPGTNPEELIGAALASCYAMALALNISQANYAAEDIRVKAVVSLVKTDDGFSIDGIRLEVQAKVPEIDSAEFQELARATKEGCPVSNALSVDIQLDALLL